MEHLLFVYGTLRVVGSSRNSRAVDPEVTHPEAYLEGFKMLDLGPFPGIIEGEGRIRGEVHRIRTPEQYDAYEGYRPDQPEDSLYTRRQVTVQTPDEGLVEGVWVYVFNLKQLGSRDSQYVPIVESGDWFAREKDNYEVCHEDL